jgi:hypothetical protein
MDIQNRSLLFDENSIYDYKNHIDAIDKQAVKRWRKNVRKARKMG